MRAEPDGHLRRVRARDAAADDDDAAARRAGHSAEEDAAAAGGTEQLLRADLHRQAPGDLAHGGQERQRAVGQLDGLVGDGGRAGVQQRLRQRGRCGEVEVGEESEVGAQVAVFGSDGLLDLHEKFGGAPDSVGRGNDVRARGAVGLVREPRSGTCPRLDQHAVTARDELVDARRGHADAAFTVLDLFRDTDDHVRAPPLRAASVEAARRKR